VIFPHFRQSRKEAFALLRSKTYKGAMWRYGSVTATARDRIDHELKVIREKGYADYFLVVVAVMEGGNDRHLLFGPRRPPRARRVTPTT